MDLGCATLPQARPTQSCNMVSHRPRSLLLLMMRWRREVEDKNDEEIHRKTIQEYLALSDCE